MGNQGKTIQDWQIQRIKRLTKEGWKLPDIARSTNCSKGTVKKVQDENRVLTPPSVDYL